VMCCVDSSEIEFSDVLCRQHLIWSIALVHVLTTTWLFQSKMKTKLSTLEKKMDWV